MKRNLTGSSNTPLGARASRWSQWLVCGVLVTCAAVASADYRAVRYVAGIKAPWSMAWLPDGDMLVTEKSGVVHHVRNGERVGRISGVPKVHDNGQGGLMEIAVHPKFAENRVVYLTYSNPEGGRGSNTSLMRAELWKGALLEPEVIYRATPNTGRGQHYGSRIEFDTAGHLYFTIGDRGARDENPQDLARDGGKVYRIHDDGRIPKDNPFVGKEGALPAVYSWGHRNPQGMARHPATGRIWVHEHGPRGGDELNVVKAGANYGWPILSYGINYWGTEFAEGTTRPGYEDPAWYWVPSIAPSGMAFVTSEKYPDWQGGLLVGSLKFNYLVFCEIEGDTVKSATPVMEQIGRVRDVRQAPDGYLYVATEGGGIKRIEAR